MQALRELMRHSLHRSLRELPSEDRLHAAWPLVCGSALARKAEVLHLDAENVLHVRVVEPEWWDRFFDLRTQLRDDLRRIAGVPLDGIHFVSAARDGRNQRNSGR